MKKVLALVLGMLLIPFAAFGMETLSVDEMAEITGQSGVAIALDDVKVFFYTENEETWYQSESTFTSADNKYYDYIGALGLIRSDFGQMLYVNAVLASNTFQGAAGNFTSVNGQNMLRPLMIGYDDGAGNTGYMGLNAVYGFSFGNKPFAAITNVDMVFDSRALTIRALNAAEVLSLGATYRLDALTTFGAASAAYQGSYVAGTNTAQVAAVAIGLPTAEIHYKRAAGEVLQIDLSIAANPLQRFGFDNTDLTNTDTWSYGKIYYGAQQGETLSERTILVLDGFIEITPIEAYANPKFQ